MQNWIKPISWMLCADLAASCSASVAKTVVVPASQPTVGKVEMDFAPIPQGACSPPFDDGIFVSYKAANDLVVAQRKRDKEHRLELLDVEERAALAESRARSAEQKAADSDSWLSRYGLFVGFGGGVATTIAAVIAAWAMTK